MALVGSRKAGAFKKLGRADELNIVSKGSKVLTPGTKSGKSCSIPKGFGR